MSKYYKSSDYCPDDKDITDFLTASGAGLDNIIEFLKQYGIFISSRDKRSEVIEYLSSLTLSWNQATKLIDIVDLPDTEEYWSRHGPLAHLLPVRLGRAHLSGHAAPYEFVNTTQFYFVKREPDSSLPKVGRLSVSKLTAYTGAIQSVSKLTAYTGWPA